MKIEVPTLAEVQEELKRAREWQQHLLDKGDLKTVYKACSVVVGRDFFENVLQEKPEHSRKFVLLLNLMDSIVEAVFDELKASIDYQSAAIKVKTMSNLDKQIENVAEEFLGQLTGMAEELKGHQS